MEKNQIDNSTLFSGEYQMTEIFESRGGEKILAEAKNLGLKQAFWEETFTVTRDSKSYEIPFEKIYEELKETR